MFARRNDAKELLENSIKSETAIELKAIENPAQQLQWQKGEQQSL
ncbi:MAG: hypothetical protein ABIR18_01555 [Chitinophagaceae bacterium]